MSISRKFFSSLFPFRENNFFLFVSDRCTCLVMSLSNKVLSEKKDDFEY